MVQKGKYVRLKDVVIKRYQKVDVRNMVIGDVLSRAVKKYPETVLYIALATAVVIAVINSIARKDRHSRLFIV